MRHPIAPFEKLLITLIGLAMALTSCAKAPEASLTEAKSALAAAELARAEIYAPQQLQVAREALAAAEAEIKIQDEQSAIARSYSKAEELLGTAAEKAKEAEDAATEAQSTAEADMQSAMEAARNAVRDTEQALGELEACAAKPDFETRKAVFVETMARLNARLNAIGEQQKNSDDLGSTQAAAEALKLDSETATADIAAARSEMDC